MMGVGGRVESWLKPADAGPGVVTFGDRSDKGDLSESLSVDKVRECDRLEVSLYEEADDGGRSGPADNGPEKRFRIASINLGAMAGSVGCTTSKAKSLMVSSATSSTSGFQYVSNQALSRLYTRSLTGTTFLSTHISLSLSVMTMFDGGEISYRLMRASVKSRGEVCSRKV